MKRLLWIAAIALVVVSCNKDQKAVKRLDGTWNVSSWLATWNGTTEEYIADGYTFTMKFDNCKLKDEEFCSITMTEAYQGSTDSYVMEYRVAGGGTSLEIRDLDYPSELTYFRIDEMTKDKLVLYLDEGDGDYSTLTLNKE
ncbi:hypothetical protein K6119_02175 [Paracrocinitomix mangrovi]|uniref:hypothetical protein n=1 Tax=Paracrocinitomix mangrovi TaxID=2862509 RepID=UPI001C8D73CF|nr:hypothetical protein [Paracrocinitomix mangrovi]UKN02326.1 hypothetical protein K6119_02175 [Paracrocinitomix mangrovi]